MADNTQVNTGSGDLIRTVQRGGSAGPKSDVSIIDRGGSASEDLGPLYGDTASGSITGTTAVSISKPFGMCSVGVQVTGTWAATLQFEVSVDGTNFTPTAAVPAGTSGAIVSTTTANGIWQCDVTGMAAFRVNCTAFTSGTAVVTLISSIGDSGGRLSGAIPGGTNLIGYSGSQSTYSTPTVVTIGMAGLLNGANAVGNNIDNSVTRYSRLLVQVKVRCGGVALPAINGHVDIYLARSIDGAVTWDAAQESTLLGAIPANQGTTSYAATFEVNDPGPGYRVIVVNNTGGTLDSTAANHSVKILGIY
jgi:hypothetical protein